MGLLFPFKICKHVCLVLMEMSNLKRRELVHHLSKLQLALAAQHDIIREQHTGKGEKQTWEHAVQRGWEQMRACLLGHRSAGIKLTLKQS